MKVVISAGHGKNVPGAVGYLNEFDENCRVMERVAERLGKDCAGSFVDTVSKTQDENLKRIVNYHNSRVRDIDVSIHFNASKTTNDPMGTECLYVTQQDLATRVAKNVAISGLKDRGAKKRTDLYFLNKTAKPAILIEVCFVDSKADTDIYNAKFEEICAVIAETVSPTAAPATGLIKLTTIGNVTIWRNADGSYIRFESDLDICNDGSGPSHGDPSYQPQTAYYNGGKYLNADVDKYIVIPPQVRKAVKPVVMGCQAKLTRVSTGVAIDAVTGEIGPPDKTGEAAYCAAKAVNPAIGYNTGDKRIDYLYELWPGKPAVVDGKTYKLEPAK